MRKTAVVASLIDGMLDRATVNDVWLDAGASLWVTNRRALQSSPSPCSSPHISSKTLMAQGLSMWRCASFLSMLFCLELRQDKWLLYKLGLQSFVRLWVSTWRSGNSLKGRVDRKSLLSLSCAGLPYFVAAGRLAARSGFERRIVRHLNCSYNFEFV